jgi:HEXXH motif-containing protein
MTAPALEIRPVVDKCSGSLDRLLHGLAKRELWCSGVSGPTWERVAALHSCDLSRHTTAFLRRDLHGLAAQRIQPNSAQTRRLLTLAADSFLPMLPSGTMLEIPAGPAGEQRLPRAGLCLQLPPQAIALGNCGNVGVVVAAGNARLTGDANTCRNTELSVPASVGEYIVTNASDRDLFDATALAQIDQSCSHDELMKFSTRIDNVLARIALAAPELSDAIRQQIGVYVLLKGTDGVHRSFSCSDLQGVVFLSDARSLDVLCEAVVHEHGHNELHRIMDVDPLVDSEPETPVYSPWRPDPRPLIGLLHAVYVFENVAWLFERMLAGNCAESAALVQRRLDLINMRLLVGIGQIDEERLTEMGRWIWQLILRSFSRRQSARQIPSSAFHQCADEFSMVPAGNEAIPRSDFQEQVKRARAVVERMAC